MLAAWACRTYTNVVQRHVMGALKRTWIANTHEHASTNYPVNWTGSGWCGDNGLLSNKWETGFTFRFRLLRNIEAAFQLDSGKSTSITQEDNSNSKRVSLQLHVPCTTLVLHTSWSYVKTPSYINYNYYTCNIYFTANTLCASLRLNVSRLFTLAGARVSSPMRSQCIHYFMFTLRRARYAVI